MQIVGIICEYDPLHLGHEKQLGLARQALGPDTALVCMMSGDFVQRGKPAIVHKSVRARAAILSGADLVLELPVTGSLSSAEGFAAQAVALLGAWCTHLCFGAEDPDPGPLMATAQALLSDQFPPAVRQALQKGLSFPAARAAALEAMGLDPKLVSSPNDILGVEYCKAIISQGVPMIPMPIHRPGSYHDQVPSPTDPSATAVRRLMLSGEDYRPYLPPQTARLYENASLHALSAGERAVLARLRTMTEEAFQALPYGSEGLWRKLMHAARREATLEAVAAAVKSKRYARSRIDRMIACAFLGLTAEDLAAPAPYARVLALNDRGRTVLSLAREHGLYPNLGQKLDCPYEQIEDRAAALYGLFALDGPEPPPKKQRPVYIP